MRKEKQNGKHLKWFSSEDNRKQKKSQGSRGYQCWVLPSLLRKLGGSSLKLPFKEQTVGQKSLVSSALFYITGSSDSSQSYRCSNIVGPLGTLSDL